MYNHSIDEEFNITYDNKYNKILVSANYLIQYLRYLCNQLCNPEGEDSNSIEHFLQNIYSNKENWKCFICNKQLIIIEGYTGRIIYSKNACINHYQKYDDTSGPIRGLLCNICHTKEQYIANNFKIPHDWCKMESKIHFKKIIKFWENTNYYSCIPMDIRPDKKILFTPERYPQKYIK